MSFWKWFCRQFVEEDRSSPRESPRQTNRSSPRKYIIVKHQGQLKRYRINKYGEIFEE
jgi:hypothetical protein